MNATAKPRMTNNINHHIHAKDMTAPKHILKRNIIIALLSVSLFLILLFGSMNAMIFDRNFYSGEYSKNNVYAELSLNGFSSSAAQAKTMAQNVTENILEYFHGGAELKYFAGDEKSHMENVKSLINIMDSIYYAAVIFSILIFVYLYYSLKKDRITFIEILAKSLLYSSIVCIAFLVIIFLMCVFYFDAAFTLFHLVLFPQGNWTFLATSLLITLFPEQFFMDISLRIFVYAMFQALIFLGIGWWINKQIKVYGVYKK